MVNGEWFVEPWYALAPQAVSDKILCILQS